MLRQRSILFVTSTLCAVLTLASSWARAQSAAVEASARTSAGDVIGDDVLADRAWFTPTAFTQPGGTVNVATHLLPLPMVATSIGITDRLHLTAAGAYDWFGGNGESGYALGAKLQLLRTRRVAVAAQGMAYRVEEEHAASGALTTSICMDPDCRNLFTVNLGAFHADNLDLGLVGASWIARISRRARFVVEADVARQLNEREHGNFSGFAFFAGARLATGRWAADLGIGSLLDDTGDSSPPLPMFSLACRLENEE
jgi:hypothetical protein